MLQDKLPADGRRQESRKIGRLCDRCLIRTVGLISHDNVAAGLHGKDAVISRDSDGHLESCPESSELKTHVAHLAAGT